MSFKDDNLRFALLKAMVDAATAELAQMRDGHLPPLLERYDEDGTKSFSVRLPSTGALIGALTLPESKDKFEVVDEAAFTAWFAENHPDAVEVEVIPAEPERKVVVPATPEQKVTTIDPKHRTAIVKGLESTDDGIVDPVTGSYVQGVQFTAGKRPDKFAVTYEKDGREKLVAAYRAGELDALVGGTALPPVNGRVIVERHLEPVPVAPPEAVEDQPVTTAAEMLGPDPWVPGPRPAATHEINLALGTDDYGDDDPWVATIDDPTWAPAAGGEFDPGDWGASSTPTGTGW